MHQSATMFHVDSANTTVIFNPTRSQGPLGSFTQDSMQDLDSHFALDIWLRHGNIFIALDLKLHFCCVPFSLSTIWASPLTLLAADSILLSTFSLRPRHFWMLAHFNRAPPSTFTAALITLSTFTLCPRPFWLRSLP